MEHLDPEELARTAEGLVEQGIDVVRLGYSDIIGTDRGRDLLVSGFERTAGGGVAFCRSVYATTPMGDVVDIEGGIEAGLPDIIARPVLDSIKALPWEPGVAHCIGDLFNADGTPSQESPRNVLKGVATQFAQLGVTPMIGPELEFYVLERDEKSETGWGPYGSAPGNVYVSGLRGDPDNSLLDSLRSLEKYDLDVVAANHEFSSGQFEINMWHSDALDAADRSHRFKAAVQELSRYHDKLATFMPKPFNGEGGSGFHLHFSALAEDGTPVFDDPDSPDGLSDLAHHAIAGILAHAPALAALSNPTINSYKRFGPDTLAPWLIDWGLDNRSAMVRIPPERGKASRMELRLGDASANPYLAIAAMMAAAFLGIRDKMELQPPLEGYGYDLTKADQLPASLGQALDALEGDQAMIDLLGAQFVKTFVAYKRNEIDRFNAFITDWEFREYTYHL